jgi:tRNA (cytidine/uridine-2'-O-)-methyltransferase
MFDVVLVCPQIPPNTGNIIRLAANTGVRLHLIKPYGFIWEDKLLKRSGLDYHDLASVSHHESLDAYIHQASNERLFVCSTRGKEAYHKVCYQKNDAFLFGNETHGLSSEAWEKLSAYPSIYIPMLPLNRSLNLANSVGIVVYEGWRQLNFSEA